MPRIWPAVAVGYSNCFRRRQKVRRAWYHSGTRALGVFAPVSLRRAPAGIIAELVESGLQAQDAERDRFLKAADWLTSSKDPDPQAASDA
jgi:hypothetical protein